MTTNSSTGTRLSLISRVRSDESAAWRELVELYGPLIQFWCRNKGLPTDAAHDCVQEVFMSVLRSLHSFSPSETSGGFRGWLWTITHRKIIDAFRKQNRTIQATGGSSALDRMHRLLDESSLDDEPTSAAQLKGLLLRAMNQVRTEFEQKTWRAFERTVIDGLSNVAAASELGLSLAAIRQYRARVLRRLRQQLGDMI